MVFSCNVEHTDTLVMQEQGKYLQPSGKLSMRKRCKRPSEAKCPLVTVVDYDTRPNLPIKMATEVAPGWNINTFYEKFIEEGEYFLDWLEEHLP